MSFQGHPLEDLGRKAHIPDHRADERDLADLLVKQFKVTNFNPAVCRLVVDNEVALVVQSNTEIAGQNPLDLVANLSDICHVASPIPC